MSSISIDGCRSRGLMSLMAVVDLCQLISLIDLVSMDLESSIGSRVMVQSSVRCREIE